jgi:thiol-disulfide isomerase/thioredoxin
MRVLVVAVMAAACATQHVAREAPPPAREATPPVGEAPKPPSTLAQLEASLDLGGNVIGASDAPTVVIVMASWCRACREELARFDQLRASHPRVRWLGVNYKQHEEYDGRGNASAIAALAHEVPWLRIVPAEEALYTAVGRPAKIPSVLVFRGRQLVARFDRERRAAPTHAELDALLR